ncbi:MAG: hypothetical protein AAF316_00385 [Cyanobacteria bacterium P01_A01_bin.80]
MYLAASGVDDFIEKQDKYFRHFLNNAKIINLRRTDCEKYFQGSELEIWKMGWNQFYLAWKTSDGFFEGQYLEGFSYQQAKAIRQLGMF